ncbi:major capsid protein [soil metagenome]
MSDILFDTATLQGVVRALPQPRLGFGAKYFNTIIESDSPEIHFDVEGTDLSMAPFVSPLVPGQIVLDEGFKTKTFRPAYIKDKKPFTPQRVTTRLLGEAIGGEYSPAERLQLALAQDLSKKLDRLERRLEWMAVQALMYGRVTVVGDYYPSRIVDFGRDSGNTIVKTTGNKWGDAGVSPLNDLHTWSDIAEAPISDWYMTPDLFAIFRDSDDVQKRMDMVRGTSTLQPDAVMDRNLVLMGMIDGFRIWVVPKLQVKNSDGTVARLVPDGTVIGVSDSYFEGVRHFGAIQDVEHFEPGAYYVKSWVEQDPSVRYLLLQSAPLMVPYRPNSTLRITAK